MKQRPPDAKPRKAGGVLAQVLTFLVLVVAGLVVMRSLGPGGSPGKEPEAIPPEIGEPVGGSAFLTGRVLDSGGHAVAGASVQAVIEFADGSTPQVVDFGPTESDGRFTISWRHGKGVARIRASLGRLVLDHGPAQGNVDLRLPATFPVSGRILAAEDGRPLEGMEVKLGERVAKTDDRGRFSFGQIPGDAVLADIEVTGAGRRPLRRALPAAGGLDDLHLSVEGE